MNTGGLGQERGGEAASGKTAPQRTHNASRGATRCRRKFLRVFPEGFTDSTYLDWERDYKWKAHERWSASLGAAQFRDRIRRGDFEAIARNAVAIESRTNLLFSFEKMALREAVLLRDGARAFAEGLYEWLYGRLRDERRFERWCEVVASLPRSRTRVLTWPVVTVFGFIARPDRHVFLKPKVTRAAAAEYGFDFAYQSRPNWDTYASLLAFAHQVCRDQRDLCPRDLIDAQSFIWVQGSDEYEE
jgi:hypothetical protein